MKKPFKKTKKIFDPKTYIITMENRRVCFLLDQEDEQLKDMIFTTTLHSMAFQIEIINFYATGFTAPTMVDILQTAKIFHV